mgnify:CR=1 FL=1
MKILRIRGAVVVEASFDRPNLTYEVVTKEQDPFKQLGQIIQHRFHGKCGIVYCLSKNECMDVCEYLIEKFHIKTVYYHAPSKECWCRENGKMEKCKWCVPPLRLEWALTRLMW